MKFTIALLLGLGQSAIAGGLPSETTAMSVSFNTASGQYVITDGISESADASGYYYTNFNQSSWNHLDIAMKSSVSSVSDHFQFSKSLGYLEGYMTCNTIKTFWPNFYSAMWGAGEPGSQTLTFLKSNFAWMEENAAKYADSDDYWYAVGATVQQVRGLFEGYAAGCASERPPASRGDAGNPYATIDTPSLEHFLLINAWGDLYQITVKFREMGMNAMYRGVSDEVLLRSPLFNADKTEANLTSMLQFEENNKVKRVERCSAIVKLLPDFSDVVFGHVTWDSFESLGPRIFKHYRFPLVRSGSMDQLYDTHFSSSPGLLSSVDDFFVVSGYAQMAVIETTNSLYNIQLLEQVVPESMLSWSRAVVSNQMASSGADWPVQFARYASGTYTNQWMSIDYAYFTPGTVPEEGFLNVFEEVPGLVHYADQTAHLVETSYWASYNVPFYEDISIASGYAAACRINDGNCYETCPRAQIFAEYHTQIHDVDGAQWMLGYNSYLNDTASEGNACNAISCRGDLSGSGAFGALDVKATSVTLSNRPAGAEDLPIINARLGPTYDQQPVFCWSTFAKEPAYSHEGQPDCFDFPYQQFPAAR